ncbi:MAG: hypothetical protein AAF351_00285 [Pseudomonadota bacterium]
MNSEKLKAYIELIGIFGIIVSLIFVGIELRNSNIQARAAAFQAIGIATAEFHQNFDDRLNVLYDQSFDPEALKTWSYEDWLAADRSVRADLRLFETALLQVEQGLLDEQSIVTLGFAVFGNGWLSNPGAVCLWPRVSQGFGAVGPQARSWIENGTPVEERADCPIEWSELRP